MLKPDDIWALLESVKDPEIPALSVLDMGIIRDISVNAGSVSVVITPTYSGCPAMKMIEDEIRNVLVSAGCASVNIKTQLSPPWTTDWLSERAKNRLRESGIAPPVGQASTLVNLKRGAVNVNCPYCGSSLTESRSDFGSTPCKALYFCNDCQQPFDYFKPH